MTDPAPEPLPITAYIRTLNEARMIADVVRAAGRVADEVVVVDSGSTDGTQALAEAEGARVIHQDWLGNGFQKRVGEDAARHDWLLDLDADEIVSAPLEAALRDVFAETPTRTAYGVRLAFKPGGRPVLEKSFPTVRVKLYDRRAHRQPEHKVWDQLEGVTGAPVLQGYLIHHIYDDLAELVHKMNRGSSNRAENAKQRSVGQLRARVLVGFPIYFLRNYLYRGGWRAGTYGVALSAILSWSRWLRDVKQFDARTRS
ncbi:MAG: glycosyltransferase family 2 protein [Pseudomonadota bacterium]